MEEQWKDIEGYEGLYQVSSEGRVKSIERTTKTKGNGYRTVTERILKPAKTRKGYQRVLLYKEGNKKNMQVHRLVAQAFLPNPDDLSQVNHKNEDKENNHVDNLEWCDASYNVNYGTRNERSGEKRSKLVQQFTLDGFFVREWPSTIEAGRNGFHQGNVWSCCRGKRKQHKGFLWRYKEDAPA